MKSEDHSAMVSHEQSKAIHEVQGLRRIFYNFCSLGEFRRTSSRPILPVLTGMPHNSLSEQVKWLAGMVLAAPGLRQCEEEIISRTQGERSYGNESHLSFPFGACGLCPALAHLAGKESGLPGAAPLNQPAC